jgi:hypothetical protein
MLVILQLGNMNDTLLEILYFFPYCHNFLDESH